MYVSVPIRGLFNLTTIIMNILTLINEVEVSVPIRGLFNLTDMQALLKKNEEAEKFPSPSGDYLI